MGKPLNKNQIIAAKLPASSMVTHHDNHIGKYKRKPTLLLCLHHEMIWAIWHFSIYKISKYRRKKKTMVNNQIQLLYLPLLAI